MVSATASRPVSNPNVDAAMERFVSMCRERGLSVTPQRLALYRALVETTSHPTPEVLFAEVRAHMPTLSLATVYKAIDTFKELGLIREIRVPDDQKMRLDADVSPHHHLVCLRCHRVVDLHVDLLDGLPLPEEAMCGFTVQGCSLQFTGICRSCKEE